MALGHADHAEGHRLDLERAADGRRAAEQPLGGHGAEEDDARRRARRRSGENMRPSRGTEVPDRGRGVRDRRRPKSLVRPPARTICDHSEKCGAARSTDSSESSAATSSISSSTAARAALADALLQHRAAARRHDARPDLLELVREVRVEALHRRPSSSVSMNAPQVMPSDVSAKRTACARRLRSVCEQQRQHGYSIRSVSGGVDARRAPRRAPRPRRSRRRHHAERERHHARREHRDRHEIGKLEAPSAAQPATPSADADEPARRRDRERLDEELQRRRRAGARRPRAARRSPGAARAPRRASC